MERKCRPAEATFFKHVEVAQSKGHSLRRASYVWQEEATDFVYCAKCGCYTAEKWVGLLEKFKNRKSGQRRMLKRIRRGQHPVFEGGKLMAESSLEASWVRRPFRTCQRLKVEQHIGADDAQPPDG